MNNPSPHPWGRRAAWLVTLPVVGLVVALAAVSCGKHGAPSQNGAAVKPSKVKLARVVDLAQVQRRAIVYHIEVVGMLEAEGQTDIAAGVAGVIDEVLFREGDEVAEGTVLVKIDQVRYEAEHEASLAMLQRANASVKLASELLKRAESSGAGVSLEEKAKARGNLDLAEAELRNAKAMLTKAKNNLERLRVRAPYAGRINKRLVTKGSYVEDKTPVATIADLSKIRLVGYVPETAAPLVRNLFHQQDDRLDAARATLPLGGFGPGIPWGGLAGLKLLESDYILSGFDPEFELLAFPGYKFHARLFYMSTVADKETHMFEIKAEVLGWSPEQQSPWIRNILNQPKAKQKAMRLALNVGGWFGQGGVWSGLAGQLLLQHLQTPQMDVELRPGYTAKVRLPMRSNPNAAVIPEEAGKWEAVRASEHGFIAFVPVPERDEQGRVVKDKAGMPQWVAQRRRLELGFRAPGWVEVRSGLEPGEWVVRRGADTLEEGTPLAISPQQVAMMLGSRE